MSQTPVANFEDDDDSIGRALVVGGSGGVGGSVCRALARDGWDVVVGYRSNLAAAEAVAVSVGERGRRADLLQVDLTDETKFSEALDSLAAKPISGLVCAAGPVFPLEFVANTDAEQYEYFLKNDALATYQAVRGSLSQLRQTRGAIVAVSSSAVSRTARKDLLSAAPKAANDALIRAVAAEEGVHGVRANSVAVGLLEGDGMWQVFRDRGEYDDAVLEPIKKSLPLRRFGSVDDVAEAVAFLLSSRAGWITGQTLNVDGGFAL